MKSGKKFPFQKSYQNLTRRDFIKSSLVGLSSVGLFSTLTACSTFDEFIFDDHTFLKDQVIIIGGGISGLYLAYKLRQLKTEFRLFEGSSTLGGRIRSNEGLDFGASIFNQTDVNLKKIIKEFNLSEGMISKSQFYIEGGAEQITRALQSRVAGLMPYRNLRVKWRLIEIRKINGNFNMIFETPTGWRTIIAKKVALTVPPSQWGRIIGLLDLPEMNWARAWLQTLQPETIFKIATAVPTSLAGLSALSRKGKIQLIAEKKKTSLDLSVVVKNFKNNISALEFEFLEKQTVNQNNFSFQDEPFPEMENLLAIINAKTKLGLTTKKISAEAFFNWSQVDLIRSAYFKNSKPPPPLAEYKKVNSSNFEVFGDYTSLVKPHSVEGALLEADRVSSLFV